jgi:hypothetical protein
VAVRSWDLGAASGEQKPECRHDPAWGLLSHLLMSRERSARATLHYWGGNESNRHWLVQSILSMRTTITVMLSSPPRRLASAIMVSTNTAGAVSELRMLSSS